MRQKVQLNLNLKQATLGILTEIGFTAGLVLIAAAIAFLVAWGGQ
ncbi:MAG TPA: hypothetical protein VK464_07605 [Symbiobacteriaceae bacterium]|jgi:hypothetical protein|nr:hypothetical protein [Symbiobacteriaceae bacterium]